MNDKLIEAADELADAAEALRNAQRSYLASKEYNDPKPEQQARGVNVGKCARIVDDAIANYRTARDGR